MNKSIFDDALSYIDESYIDDADTYKRRRTAFSLKKLGVIAASVLIFALCGIGALASSGIGTDIIEFVSYRNSDEYRYEMQLKADIERIPMSEIRGEANKIGGEMLQQIENHTPWSSTTPTYFRKEFPTSDSALEYIGLDRIELISFSGYDLRYVTVTADGNYDGELTRLNLEVFDRYLESGINYSSSVHIFTEHADKRSIIKYGVISDVYSGFTPAEFTNASGLKCVYVSSTGETGRNTYSAHIMKNGLWYEFHISHPKELDADAFNMMKAWADKF